MLIPLFASFHQTIVGGSSINQPNINDFVQEEQHVVPNEQLQPQDMNGYISNWQKKQATSQIGNQWTLMTLIALVKLLYTMNVSLPLFIDWTMKIAFIDWELYFSKMNWLNIIFFDMIWPHNAFSQTIWPHIAFLR